MNDRWNGDWYVHDPCSNVGKDPLWYAPDLVRETDTELGYRLHANGLGFVFAPDAVVSEYRSRRWLDIVRDTVHRGQLAVDLYRRHPPMIEQMPLGGRGELSRPRSRQMVERLLLGRVRAILPSGVHPDA